MTMLAVVDVGNTNTVLGLFEDETLKFHWRLHTHGYRTVDEFGVMVHQLFRAHEVDVSLIDASIIACVMPTMLPIVRSTMTRYFQVDPLVVGPGIKTQMPILAENPREVGADRIVNAVAAYERYQEGLIVVDFGTATTFDVVTPQGKYMGGAIAPGLRISAEALFRSASKLPRVELELPGSVVGRNTVSSMQSGILFGYVGLVTEIVSRMRGALSFPVRCVATGGLAAVIAQEATCIEEVLPNLTLEGLRLLYQRNVR